MTPDKNKAVSIGAILFVVAGFVALSSSPRDGKGAITISPLSADHAAAPLPHEKMCNAEVCPRQILVKLRGCPTADRMPVFTKDLEKLFQNQTDDELGEVSQVGSGCLFLVRSSRLNVKELIQRVNYLKANQSNQALLTRFGLNDVTFEYGEPNFRIRFDSGQAAASPLPDDERFLNNEQWGLGSLQVQGADADVVRAWKSATGSKGVVVGVLDTGLATQHEDLKDNLWRAPNNFTVYLDGKTITCLKDSYGYNALGATEEGRCLPEDDAGHGTMVTGVIGAKGNNRVGIVGVNWNVTLLGLRIGDGSGTCVSNAIKGIDFAIQLKRQFPKEANIRMLNASWGYISSPGCEASMKSLKDKIVDAGTCDILFVSSAGNGGNNNDAKEHYPSGFDLENVISVTAVGRNGAIYHSNHGKTTVHLGAPGEKILSTFPPPRNYDHGGFTSMAAPYVSGAAALILSAPGCENLHARDLKRLILNGTMKTRALNETSSGGQLSVYNSIEACKRKP